MHFDKFEFTAHDRERGVLQFPCVEVILLFRNCHDCCIAVPPALPCIPILQ
jgi:hypothetical protein